MTGTIKVSPEKLKETASSFSSEGSKIQTLTNEMLNKISALSSAWEGEAATAYINKFKSLETDIQTLIRMINEHVSDLNQMAEAYATTERQNESDASSLSSGILCSFLSLSFFNINPFIKGQIFEI